MPEFSTSQNAWVQNPNLLQYLYIITDDSNFCCHLYLISALEAICWWHCSNLGGGGEESLQISLQVTNFISTPKPHNALEPTTYSSLRIPVLSIMCPNSLKIFLNNSPKLTLTCSPIMLSSLLDDSSLSLTLMIRKRGDIVVSEFLWYTL